MRAALAQPYRPSSLTDELPMSCSVGLALDDGPTDSLSALLHRADVDMYQHKRPAI